MNEIEEAIITGMDIDTTWMYMPKIPKRIKRESTKDKKTIDNNIKRQYNYSMKYKLFDTLYTNEMLLTILPFNTGYLLKEDDKPCESSVMIAMILQGLDHSMHPHKAATDPYRN